MPDCSGDSPAMEPQSVEELALRLHTLRDCGYVESVANGSQSAGKTLEYYLSVDDRHGTFEPDLSAGIELKVVSNTSDTPITLLTFEPTTKYRWGNELVSYYWGDEDTTEADGAAKSLHTTVRADQTDANGLSLDVADNGDVFVVDEKADAHIARYRGDELASALTQKFDYLMVVEATRKTVGLDQSEQDVFFRYTDATYFSDLDLAAVRDRISDGAITLDIRMKEKHDGTLRNHGTAWRIQPEALSSVYGVSVDVFDSSTQVSNAPSPNQEVLVDRDPVATIQSAPSGGGGADESGRKRQQTLTDFRSTRTEGDEQETLTAFV